MFIKKWNGQASNNLSKIPKPLLIFRLFANPTFQYKAIAPMHTAIQSSPSAPVAGGSWSLTSIRTKIRNYFPRAKETKRIVNHGWHKRMSSPSGRKIIMRRILKGKHVLCH